MILFLRKKARSTFYHLMSVLFPTRWKEFIELKYWRRKKREEGVLSNDHYTFFYTDFFGLDKSFYKDKVILDIGCGPRGSLEWADNTKRRIGLDPLAKEYLKLGADKHQMEYINAPSESIPLNDNECDVIFSFNSLDHVENIADSINEIKRCLKPGGLFLLMVEINHAPTSTEPHNLTPEMLLSCFKPEFEPKEIKTFEPVANGMYQSVLKNIQYSDPMGCKDEAYFTSKFEKIA